MDALTYRAALGLKGRHQGVPRLSGLARMIADSPEQRAAYNAVLDEVRLSAILKSGNAVLVTSTQSKDGKTTIASCLAIVASLAGLSVLLVDGDLQRPWLALNAGMADAVGLGEVLEGTIEPAEAIHPIDLFAESREAGPISVMPAGQKPLSFLSTVDWSKARAMFQVASRPFDMAILDSPPILAAEEASLLSGIVDGVLLVIHAERAGREEVDRTRKQLSRIGTPLVGVVLNHCNRKIHGGAGQPHPGRDHSLRS